MLGAIFDTFIGSLEGICDILEFGPVEAFRINTAGCPEGERAQRRVVEHFNQYINAYSVEDDSADELDVDEKDFEESEVELSFERDDEEYCELSPVLKEIVKEIGEAAMDILIKNFSNSNPRVGGTVISSIKRDEDSEEEDVETLAKYME